MGLLDMGTTMKRIAIIAFMLAALAACAETVKVPQATGGSRADASVVLSYQVGVFENVRPDWAAAQTTAARRCEAWGYTQADPFEGTQIRCEQTDIYGTCLLQTVSRTYQCLG